MGCSGKGGRRPAWARQPVQLSGGRRRALPFEDETFDLVTCQTLLIHVADPAAVIAEMRRVVAPGGMVLLSEPNNLAGRLVADSTTVDKRLPEAVERIEFALICERGKTAVGEATVRSAICCPAWERHKVCVRRDRKRRPCLQQKK